MATFTSYNEPPVVPPEQPLDLSAMQAQLQEAFRAGNFREISRLNAALREIADRLRTETTSNERFKRIQVNPNAAPEEDRAYADTLIRNLGAIQQMVELTQRAADTPEVESPGLSVGEEVAGTAAALSAADVAGQEITKGAVGRSQDAATAAKRSISGKAGAAQRAATKAKGAASAAGGAVGRAGQAVAKAAADPIINPTPGTPGTPGTKGAAQKALRTAKAEQAAAKGTSAAATRTATSKAAQAATSKAAAKAFASTAARAAPRIFGGMPLLMAEAAVAPILAFYETTEQARSFLGQLEKLSELKGGPLGVDDLNTETLDALSTSPALVDSMLKSEVIDSSAYAFANPQGAAEMGLQIGAGGIQRGGDIPVIKGVGTTGKEFGPDPGEAAWQETAREFEGLGAAGGGIPRVGSGESTPVARKAAATRAWEKKEGAKTKPKATSADAAPAPAPTKAEEPHPWGESPSYKADPLYPEPGQREPGFDLPRLPTPDLAPPKERKLGKGLKKLLETFATMDIGPVDVDV